MKVKMIDDLIHMWNYLVEKVCMFFSAIYYFFFPTQLPAEFSADTPVSACCMAMNYDMKHQPTLRVSNPDVTHNLQSNMWDYMKFPQLNRAEVKLASQYNRGVKHPSGSPILLRYFSSLSIIESSPPKFMIA